MRAEWRKYLRFHLWLLLAVCFFAAWAFTMERLFPRGYFYCFLHDVMRLYCPFCGATRALKSLLRLQFFNALRYHGALILVGLPALALEIRALWILLGHREGELLWPQVWQWLWRYLYVCCLFRNTAMLLGADSIGDLAPLWSGLPVWRALLFLPLAALAYLCICVTVYRKGRKRRLLALSLGILLLCLLFVVLYGKWWILFFAVFAVLPLLFCGQGHKKPKEDET